MLFRLVGSEPALGDDGVDPRQHRARELVAGREGRLDARAEARDPVVHSLEAPDDDRASPGEPAGVTVVSAVVPGDRRVAGESRRRSRQRVHRLVEKPDLESPVQVVVPAVPTREPGAAARREVDAPPGPQELVGDLAARLAAADDEHGSFGELVRPPVLARRQLELDRRRVGSGHTRARLLEGTGRDDDVGRLEHIVTRLRDVVFTVASEARHRAAPANGSGKGSRVLLDVLDHVGERRERVRVAALVFRSGKLERPVRRIEIEAVPALRAPGLADGSALEDEVLAPALREEEARGEPRLARADHDRVDALHPG